MTCKTILSLALAVAAVNAAQLGYAAEKKQTGIIEEELVVVGYRGSIQNALKTKQRSSQVVESVFATDIGKLPDSSIAESIARLPGVAAQRLDGRASSITIRGLGEHFNPATLNGREQVSLNDNRGIEFDIYPAEIVHQVLVYKTPEAKLINQGIGGTIELRTKNPLDYNESSFSVNTRAEYNAIGALNPDGEEIGKRLSATYIDQFADDTIGLAISYAQMDSPNNEERWNSWGWSTNNEGNFVLNGAKPFVRSSLLTRDTLMGILQYSPNESFSVTLDMLRIEFEDEKILRGIEIPIYNNDANDGILNPVVVDGMVTSGIIDNAEVVMRNDYELREATLASYGGNFEFKPSELWTWEVDFSHASVKREVTSIESYAGTGRGTGNGDTIDLMFSVNSNQQGVQFTPGVFDAGTNTFSATDGFYSSYDRFQLGGPLSWGGAHPLTYQNRDSQSAPVCAEFSDQNCYRNNAQDGFFNAPEIEDELTTFKIMGELAFEDGLFSSVEFGINHNIRTKSKFDRGAFLTLPGFYQNLAEVESLLNQGDYAGALDSAEFDNNHVLPIPNQYRQGTVSLDFLGIGDMIAYDALAFYRQGGYFDGFTELAKNNQPSRATNTWIVDESITTLFAQANIDSYIGAAPVKGNVGLQLVRTDQSSDGYAAQLNSDGSVTVRSETGGTTYEDILPSANLAVEFAEDQQLRLGYSRTLARSRMDRLKASFGYGRNEWGNFTGDGGNPALRPNLANQLDLGYEWYFANQGYFASTLFYKQLDQWQILVRDNELSGKAYEALIAAGESVNFVDLNKWQTTSGGTIQGGEFTLALPAHLAAEALDGFGLVASGTFLSSEIVIENTTQVVPGLSHEVYNLTFYYENHGFEFRTSLRKRSDFLGEVYGLSFVREPVTVKGSAVWDAQISYDFSDVGVEGLAISLQAQNVTDEPFITVYNNDDRQVRDYQRYGVNYLFGVSYKL